MTKGGLWVAQGQSLRVAQHLLNHIQVSPVIHYMTIRRVCARAEVPAGQNPLQSYPVWLSTLPNATICSEHLFVVLFVTTPNWTVVESS
jgi:hypothetical protein